MGIVSWVVYSFTSSFIHSSNLSIPSVHPILPSHQSIHPSVHPYFINLFYHGLSKKLDMWTDFMYLCYERSKNKVFPTSSYISVTPKLGLRIVLPYISIQYTWLIPHIVLHVAFCPVAFQTPIDNLLGWYSMQYINLLATKEFSGFIIGTLLKPSSIIWFSDSITNYRSSVTSLHSLCVEQFTI